MPGRTPEDTERLRRACAGPVDASGDMPELRSMRPKFDSMIRRAVLDVVRSGRMTAYKLWKDARAFAPQLQRTAVYQFLAGRRQVRVEYAEAMMRAAGLKVS